MENKQTAVDFLKDKFIMIQWLLVRDEISRKQADEFLNEWYDKAKEMEKEQIKDARESYINQMLKVNDDLLIYGESKFKEMTSEQYYNETYGK